MKKLTLILTAIAIIMAINKSSNAQQGLWSANGQNIVFTNRSVGVGLNNPAYKFDVNGRVHATGNVFADSCLTAMHLYAVQKVTADALQVNNLAVFGNSITIDGTNNKITSSAGQISFGNNNIATTGNVRAANIRSDALAGSGKKLLQSDSLGNIISFPLSGNANEVLLGNGVWGVLPPKSPWIADSMGIYPEPTLPNKDVYLSQLFVEKTVNIGGFRFTNGATGPLPTDTISSKKRLALTAEKSINLLADTVTMPTRVGIGVKNPQFALDVAGNAHFHDYLWVEDGIIVGKRYEGKRAEIDTVKTKELQAIAVKAEEAVRVGNGAGMINIDGPNNRIYSTSGVLDFNGNNFSNVGTVNANTLSANNLNVSYTSFDSLMVTNKIKVGNSIVLEGLTTPTGPENHIFTTEHSGNLYLQSQSYPQNTIINKNNTGNVGIGTDGPSEKLEINGAIKIGNTENLSPSNGTIKYNPTTNDFEGYKNNNWYPLTSKWTENTDGDIYRLTGKIGIGTKFPKRNLHIKGVTDHSIQIISASIMEPIIIWDPAMVVDTTITFSTTSAVLRLQDSAINMHITPPNRNVWWDIVASGSNRRLFINKQVEGETNQTNIMTLLEDGRVGVGTTTPMRNFHIKGVIDCSLPSQAVTTLRIEDKTINNPSGNRNVWWDFAVSGKDSKFYINKQVLGQTSTNIMTLTEDGNVGIGTDEINPEYKLTVDGKIACEKVKVFVDAHSIPDYVFNEDYNLTDVNLLEEYIKEHKHLPDMPSAEEFGKNGMDLSEMNILLLKKIEELTLHLIEQNKQIEGLKKENEIFKEKFRKIEE